MFKPYKTKENRIEIDKRGTFKVFQDLQLTWYGRLVNRLLKKEYYKKSECICRVVCGYQDDEKGEYINLRK